MKFFRDIIRVWRVTRKPTKKEYFTTFKIIFVGFVVIGVIGFTIQMLWSLWIGKIF